MTIVPVYSPDALPPRLIARLREDFDQETGYSFPFAAALPSPRPGHPWLGGILVRGDVGGVDDLGKMDRGGVHWDDLCLGSFYLQPWYSGCDDCVCKGGFSVSPAHRRQGLGKLMGQCFLEWASQLVSAELFCNVPPSSDR